MQSWHAQLKLHFERRGDRTTVARAHRGPLLMQKALYPEGPEACHAIVLHPPGGIAGGDALEIAVRADAEAHALVTTPGAAKWYKANGRRAAQDIHLEVAGALEWLPQENIVFDAADVASSLRIDLASDACMIGWDITALGRQASGERFANGCFAQTIALHIDGALEWLERTRVSGDDAALASPVALGGDAVFGCLWAYGPVWCDEDLDALRERCAPTLLHERLLVVRATAANTEGVRELLEYAWTQLRPRVFAGRSAQRPRIWAT